ncbi:MAG: helix-turn-helix domain-containing protein [Deltaproteobacteria bacterium]|nr:helix-turn-helix domain-containing protein [Deltaproteobacteria bacterium]
MAIKALAGEASRPTRKISRDLNVSERTIETLKKRFVTGGLALALPQKPPKINPKAIKFADSFAAKLIALAF